MIDTEIYNLLLTQIDENKILRNEPMAKHTSFKIGGPADFFIKINNIEDIKFVISLCSKNNIPLTVIGNGTNVLVSDNGIRGIVVKINFKELKLEEHNENVKIIAGAGVLLSEISKVCLDNRLTGFEFANGIPGTIGGAVKMNAGAFGGEMKDIISKTICIDLKGNIKILTNKEQQFSYRHSIFSDNNYIILQTEIVLKKGNIDEIKTKMEQISKTRREKQPINFPSAGSVFKRGENFITAKLIDECGLKGYHIGDAEVSNLHAGFIINKKVATAKDVLKLIDYVKQTVYKKYNVQLELEIVVLGKI